MAQTAACHAQNAARVQAVAHVQHTIQSQSQPQLKPHSKWIGARELRIDWMEKHNYWVYTQVPAGPERCSPKIEVAELREVWWFYIFVRIEVKSLHKERDYGAFFVFKLKDHTTGLEQANALFRLLKNKGDVVNDDDESSTPVFIAKKKTNSNESGQFPRVRPDGWMEIQLGQDFYVEADDDGVIHMQLKSTTPVRKTGLLVRGIEVRPT